MKESVVGFQFLERCYIEGKIKELETALTQETAKLKRLKQQQALLNFVSKSTFSKLLHWIFMFVFFISLLFSVVLLLAKYDAAYAITDEMKLLLGVGLGSPVVFAWLRTEVLSFLKTGKIQSLIENCEERTVKITDELNSTIQGRS